MTKQAQAKALASWLERGNWPSYIPQEAAAELRRLPARVQELETQLAAERDARRDTHFFLAGWNGCNERKDATAAFRAAAIAASQPNGEGGSMSDTTAWGIHIPGPDDWHAAPSEEAARHMATKHNEAMNAYFDKNPPDKYSPPRESILAEARPWPWGKEDHAEALADFDAEAWGIAQPNGEA